MAMGAIPMPPAAPQPSIIRAEQKDELYLQYLVDCCYDAVRRLLGPHRALLWSRETQLLGELLYYTLTTGGGLQTLGEEYCDVLQATGGAGLAPGTLRRGTLVLLQTLAPYLAERVALQQDEGFAAWQASRLQQQREQQHSEQQRQQQQREGQGARQPASLQQWHAARSYVEGTAARLRAQTAQLLAPLSPACRTAARWASTNGAAALRVHLALFYIYGAYFQVSKRLTGVHYLFLGRQFERRTSYHVLGLLLCGQLGLSGVLWYLRNKTSLRLPGAAAARGAGEEPLKPRHAVLLDEEGQEVPPDGEEAAAADGGADVPPSRKCPLCLSARVAPTATPCGHVFCWACVAGWCSQKPECPLCRAEVLPSSLVRVYHADF